MRPFVISIWSPTLCEATKFISDLYLGENVIHFVPDLDNRGSYWIMLRVTGDEKQVLEERGKRATPRWSFL